MDHAPSQNDLTPPRASDLLGTRPFEPFLEFNRVDALDVEGDPRAWLESRLEEGKPLIIRGFKHPPHWDEELLSTNSLANFREEEEREEKRGNFLAPTSFIALPARLITDSLLLVDVRHFRRNHTSLSSLDNFIRRDAIQSDEPYVTRRLHRLSGFLTDFAQGYMHGT